MRLQTPAWLGLFALLTLTGCATNFIQFPGNAEPAVVEVKEETVTEPEPVIRYRANPRDDSRNMANVQEYWRAPVNQYNPSYTHKALADYAEQLVMQLIDSIRDTSLLGSIGVTSLVYFDHTLQQTDLLGNQLSEALLTEAQQFGLAVMDFKLTNGIAVDRSGDYVFSREARALADELAIDYVLAGTMKKTAKGVTVNARLVHSKYKSVIAAARVDIPHFLIAELAPQLFVMSD